MTLKFTKMHGLGNDFMVIDGVNQSVSLTRERITQLANRHTGVGFDQCLLVEPARQADVDFTYRIFNADGGEVGQCGNGARCLARFIQAQGLSTKAILTVATKTRQLQLQINPDDSVTVTMGQPEFEPSDIPLQATQAAAQYTVDLVDQSIQFSAVSIGNPHAIILVDDVACAEVANIGAQLSQHSMFPQGTNVGFLQIIDKTHARLRVFERGSGETQACASGACAAMIVARRMEKLESQATVLLNGGELLIAWSGNPKEVISMTGPATFVYSGVLITKPA